MLCCLYLFSLKDRRDKAQQKLSPAIISSFLSWISARGKKRFRSLFHLQNLAASFNIAIPAGIVVCNLKQDTGDTNTSRLRRDAMPNLPKAGLLGLSPVQKQPVHGIRNFCSVLGLLLGVSGTSPALATGTLTCSSTPALINLN